MSNILVSICCLTFNHETYIKECLEGFLMQEGDFDIEILIHDDASTDKTADIIRSYEKKYPHIIKPVYQTENQYSKGVSVTRKYNFPRASGKYIAMCEGDDYWIDPLKLDKQIKFLEYNPDFVVCWTNYEALTRSGLKANNFGFTKKEHIIDFNTIFRPYCTLTLTVLFKKEALDLSASSAFQYFKDNTLYAVLLTKGKGVFLDFVSAVYRIHEGGVYSLQTDFFKNYSSYLNIKEIIEFIPESRTKNMYKVMNSLGNATAFGLLKLKQNGETLSESQKNFMNTYFKNANLKTKFKYLKRKFLK